MQRCEDAHGCGSDYHLGLFPMIIANDVNVLQVIQRLDAGERHDGVTLLVSGSECVVIVS